MRAIARSAACAIGLAVAAGATTDAEKIRAVLLALSTSLADADAARFLAQIDRRRFANYATLEDNVVALAAQNEVGSSIGVLEQTANGEGFDLKLDWLLSLKPASGGPAQQRRQTVTCRLEPSGKGLKVTALAPLDFFKPL